MAKAKRNCPAVRREDRWISQSNTPISPQPQSRAQLHSPPPRRSPGVASPSRLSVASIDGTLEAAGSPRRSSGAGKDFSYLLRPEIYHPLTPADLPTAFRNSAHQPDGDASLDALLATGHFRAAAILSARYLTSSYLSPSTSSGVAPTDHRRIFSLLYIRLACLTLCNQIHLAAQEVKVLEDLNAAYYRDEVDAQHLVPWELRVLAIRLQGIGFNDPRRAVTGYYDLARDARAQLSRLKADVAVWESRLYDVGLRVAGALVDMGDLETAARHLASMRPPAGASAAAGSDLALARALLWLRMGDAEAARACMAGAGSVEGSGAARAATNRQIIEALAALADGAYETAAQRWGELCEGMQEDDAERDEHDTHRLEQVTARAAEAAMLQTNYAVALLYAGRMEEARRVLTALVTKGEQSFATLTFNLCTIYELCSEKSRALKLALAERLASTPGDGQSSWEKAAADLKL